MYDLLSMLCSHHFSTARPDLVVSGDVKGKTFLIYRGQQPIAEVSLVSSSICLCQQDTSVQLHMYEQPWQSLGCTLLNEQSLLHVRAKVLWQVNSAMVAVAGNLPTHPLYACKCACVPYLQHLHY